MKEAVYRFLASCGQPEEQKDAAIINKIIDDMTEMKTGLIETCRYTEIPTSEILNHHILSDRLHILYFMVCLEPESMAYGRGIGAFIYRDGRVFEFWYNIHTSHSKGPHKSNQMTMIQELVWDERRGFGAAKAVDTDFGHEAFWSHTPTESLGENAHDLRKLMISLQKYCRGEKYCEKLRKLDKKHMVWEAERGAKLLMRNQTYGIL